MPKYRTILYGPDGKPLGEAPSDPEELKRILQSGQAGFAAGTRINFRKPTGEMVSLPSDAAKVMEALEAGYQIETGAGREERVLQEEYGGAGGQLATAAHAAANTLTFGALDYLGGEIGGKEYTDPVRKLKQANPNLHLGAELATIAGSFIVNPASAVGKITKLPRAVGKIGRGVEKAFLKGLGGKKGGVFRQALAKGTALGTGAGIEGAAYGGAHFLSEVGLGETEATAENLLANLGMGAMWGGIAGMGMGAGGEILRRGLGAGANFAKRSSKSVVNMWERATGNKAHPDLAKSIKDQILHPKVGRYAKTFGPAIRENPENIARFTQSGPAGREARRVGSQSVKERDGYVNLLADDYDLLNTAHAGATEQMMGTMKIKNMGSIKAVKNEVALTKDAQEIVDGLKGYSEELLALKDEAGYIYTKGARSALKDIQKTTLEHERRIKEILLAKNIDDVGSAMHGAMDSYKKEIGKIRDTLRRTRQPRMLQQKIMREVEERYTLLQKHLEKPEYYGAVGIAQGKFNPVWSRTIGRGKTPMARHLRQKVGEANWRDVYATNRGGVEHMINDMGRARNKSTEEFFLSDIDDKLEFVRLTRETFDDLPPKLVKQLDEMENVAKRLRSNFMKAQDTVTLQNQMGDIIQKSSQLQSVLPMGAGAGLGYLLGGEEGLALGLGLSVFTNPGRLIQIRAALDRMASSTDTKILKSIKGYIRKATGKVKKPARGLLAPASLKTLQSANWGDKRTKDKTRQQAFTRRSKELTEFLSNPQKTVERIKKNTGDVTEVAPNVATAMQIKTVQAARYLYDRMPKPLIEHTLLQKKFKPSDLELAKFERIAAVIDNPENALKSLRAGMLTVEEVDALREVYPRMYERIVVAIAEQVPELREKLPYKEQVQLSILFGVPVSATMEPEFVMTMAAIDAAPPMPMGQPPGPKQPQSKIGDYDKLNIDSASMTDSQRVEMNKLS
jgi:hypothetical protein